MKFKNNKALSEVFGVIVMIGIVVAVVAVFYLFTGGMTKSGTEMKTTVLINFEQDDATNRLVVTYVGQQGIPWSDYTVRATDDTTLDNMGPGEGIVSASFNASVDNVRRGDIIYITNSETTVTVAYNPSSTLLSVWEFES